MNVFVRVFCVTVYVCVRVCVCGHCMRGNACAIALRIKMLIVIVDIIIIVLLLVVLDTSSHS